MKILFITRLFYPHVGGVEKHVYEVAKVLRLRGNSITILTERYDKNLKKNEVINGIKVVRFSYPHFKLLGLFFIWIWLFKNRRLIEDADIIHIHDVFIWYLPFRFLYPHKRVFTTFHGWEGVWPIPWKNIYLKRLAARLSAGTIVVGKYIEKYYGIKADKTAYGAR
jgi:glycosyltransferase involved in cell wall biosynthesis